MIYDKIMHVEKYTFYLVLGDNTTITRFKANLKFLGGVKHDSRKETRNN